MQLQPAVTTLFDFPMNSMRTGLSWRCKHQREKRSGVHELVVDRDICGLRVGSTREAVASTVDAHSRCGPR
jgi:hypothetical protein